MNFQKFFVFMMLMVATMIGHGVEAEYCQKGVDNCNKGAEPGYCGPKGNHRCCDIQRRRCYDC